MHQAHSDKKKTKKKEKLYVVQWTYITMGDEERVDISPPTSHKRAVDTVAELKKAGVPERKVRVVEYK